MRHANVTLDDKYVLESGRVFITGVQALLRVLLDQSRLDERAGLNTAGFMSGYRGSPLGGLDQQAHRAGKVLPVASSGPFLMTDVAMMVAACAAGLGIAQVLAISVQRHVASGELVELFPDWPDETFPLYAIRPSRRLAPLKVAAFIDFFEEICRPYDTRVALKAGQKKGRHSKRFG